MISTGRIRTAGAERADWLNSAFDPSQARFLLVTAITHHRFRSPAWGEHEVRKLYNELTEIERSATEAVEAAPDGEETSRISRPAG